MRIPRSASVLVLAMGWISLTANLAGTTALQETLTPVSTYTTETATPTPTSEVVATDLQLPQSTATETPSPAPTETASPTSTTETPSPAPTETVSPTPTGAVPPSFPMHVRGLGFALRGFVANVGQSDAGVAFVADSLGAELAFSDGGMVVEAQNPSEPSAQTLSLDSPDRPGPEAMSTLEPYFLALDDSDETEEGEPQTRTFEVHFLGADSAVEPQGQEPLGTRVSYYFGDDPAHWYESVPVFGEVVYADLYPGVDLVYALGSEELKSTFIVHPEGQVSAIRLAYEGIAGLTIDSDGALLVDVGDGVMFRESVPLAYQESSGERREVPVSYRLTGNEVGFSIEAGLDPTLPLMIDPTLTYLSYLGRAGDDAATDVTVDADGNVYVVGRTTGRGEDALIVKLSPDASEILYWVTLSGAGEDRATGVEVPQGGVYVVGRTDSPDFGPADARGDDVFFATLDDEGSLLGISIAGGSGDDRPFGLAFDPTSLTFYTVGQTDSTDLPRVDPYQAANRGGIDAFVAGFSVGGGLAYMSYFGGSEDDFAYDVAVDRNGRVYFTGSTASGDLPLGTFGRRSYSGGVDAYVAQLNPSSGILGYTVYLGGEGGDHGRAVAIGYEGETVIGGSTASQPTGPHPFPVTQGVIRPDRPGGTYDAFIVKLTNPGGHIAYSTFLGGDAEQDSVEGLVVDDNGGATLTGVTSTDFTGPERFPVTDDAFQSEPGGGLYDGFIAQINPSATSLVYSTYLGGNGDDHGTAVAFVRGVSSNYLAVYVAGGTGSDDLDVISPLQDELQGSLDALLARLGDLITPPAWTTSYYVTTDSEMKLYATGWTYGRQGIGGIVILDFCQARIRGSAFGVDLCGVEVPIVSLDKVESLSTSFLNGWWQGYWNGGGHSTAPLTYLTVVIGLNNCPDLATDGICNRGDVYGNMRPAHAREWAAMVERINGLVSDRGYGSKMEVHGGIDAELLWETRSITLAWLDEYAAYFQPPPLPARSPARLYDFGSCEDCQFCLNPTFTCTLPDGWTLDYAWYKSWGSPLAWPIPEIYNTLGTNATQWYTVALYSREVKSRAMLFPGVLTQWQMTGIDPQVNNRPEVGWRQLFDALDQDPRTRLPYIPWLTNIEYYKTPVPTPTQPCFDC